MEKHRTCLLSKIPATRTMSRIFPTYLSGFLGRYQYFLVNKTMRPVSQQSAPRGPQSGGHILSPPLGLALEGAWSSQGAFCQGEKEKLSPTEKGGFLGFCRCKLRKTRHTRPMGQPLRPGQSLPGEWRVGRGCRGLSVLSRNTGALESGMSGSGWLLPFLSFLYHLGFLSQAPSPLGPSNHTGCHFHYSHPLIGGPNRHRTPATTRPRHLFTAGVA